MQAPESIVRLVETFGNNLGFYRSDRYNEARLRQEFLDPFFRELGWDMDNAAGLAPQYRDVIHEASIKIGGATKAPDYAFTIHGQYKFFLEAKKPAVNLRADLDPAYQLRRYGWSAKLPVSILTDFEEFAIYDCRKRPRRNDRAATSRIGYFKFTDYIDKWDELHATFSKEGILKGSFDRYTVDARRHRGTESVDAAFLQEIEHWRNLLARNLARRNPQLSAFDVNFAVQKTIDRLIFLRICEDRGTEDYKRLRALLSGDGIYKRLLELFVQADCRYNSGLFHFSGETGRGAPDTITPEVEIDDRVLREIISKLYYPESPYEFSVLPADILGQVYEQFLGKTIRLTPGRQAKIEEKPEVRKAGGVYYTPTYIVDYIVENTLGRLLDGDDPDHPRPIPVSKASELSVLDPACGSGSFLIVAYQYLLDWHLRQYTTDPATGAPDGVKIKRHKSGKAPKIYQAPGGEWKLTTDERERILLNGIHGVDIDAQAVEVTKLSLLLKVMEGESQQIQQRDWLRERKRILPDLGDNIRCGNSLIGPEFYDDQRMLLLDDETQYRVNVFDWDTAFSKIIKRGGFDCVIGNPPYVRQESIKESKGYFSQHYASASRTADLYVYFLEKAVHLICAGGYASYIVSSSFLKTAYARALRDTLKQHSAIVQVTDFGGFPVFDSAKDTYVCIPLFHKAPQPETITVHKVNTLEPAARSEQMKGEGYTIPQVHFSGNEWSLRCDEESALFERCKTTYPPLGEVVDGMHYGLKTGYNAAFVIPADQADQLCGSTDRHSRSLIHKACSGQDIRRYHLRPLPDQIIAIPSGWTDTTYGPKSEASAWKCFSQDNPALARHLASYREKLTRRQDKGDYWWELRPCDYYNVLDSEKIIFPDICKHPRFFVDVEGSYILNTAYAIDSSDRYLLGLLNSNLFWWLISQISIPFGVRAGEFRYRLIYQYMKQVPIRRIDLSSPSDVAKHQSMVDMVERMLKLNKKRAAEENPETRRRLDSQISATDRQVDRLVYDLYDLSEGEIGLVEGHA